MRFCSKNAIKAAKNSILNGRTLWSRADEARFNGYLQSISRFARNPASYTGSVDWDATLIYWCDPRSDFVGRDPGRMDLVQR